MSKISVPLARPTLPPIAELNLDFEKIRSSGQITCGPFVEKFEKKCAQFLKVKNTVAVGSGSDAILIALMMLDKKGEVIIPSFDFSSPIHSLSILGFTPVLVDVDPETFNIDPKDVERRVSKRTVAILAPHIFGNPCDIDKLMAIATAHKLKVIFDGAHAFGSLHRGRSVAIYGDFTTFSLTPTKPLAIGEGGLITTRNDKYSNMAKSLRSNGDNLERSREKIGISSRMTEWQAAIGLAALKKLKKTLAQRLRLVKHYKKLLGNMDSVYLQKVADSDFSVYQNIAIVLGNSFPITRERLISYLREKGIETKAYFDPPLHEKIMYRHLLKGASLRNTNRISSRILSLPLFSHMTFSQVEYVADTIKKVGRA